MRDYPVLMAILMVGALVVVLGNLLADIVVALIDPRIRLAACLTSCWKRSRSGRRPAARRAAAVPAPSAGGARRGADRAARHRRGRRAWLAPHDPDEIAITDRYARR